MITNILAIAAAVAVMTTLCWALFLWFRVSLSRYDGVTAADVLNRWEAELAELSDVERALAREQPPVEVLEALLTLPSPRQRLFQLTYIR